MIQKVLHVVLGLGEHFGEDLCQSRYRRQVVLLQRRELPTRRADSARSHRRRVFSVVRIHRLVRLVLSDGRIVGMPLDHDHAARVALEQVVDEWNDNDDTCGGSCERESRESLDEAGNECGGEETGYSALVRPWLAW